MNVGVVFDFVDIIKDNFGRIFDFEVCCQGFFDFINLKIIFDLVYDGVGKIGVQFLINVSLYRVKVSNLGEVVIKVLKEFVRLLMIVIEGLK